MALAVAGVAEPTNVSLKAQPTIQTPIGPITYPQEITVVDRRIGTTTGQLSL